MGELVLRVEDIDTPRVVVASEGRQLEDLRWLGLDWDEGPDIGGNRGPYRQSERALLYENALERLATTGWTYLCDCSRSDIASSASAPHSGDEGPRYPGTCRRFGMQPRDWKRPPALRLAVPDREIVVHDVFQGELRQNLFATVGDFVLKRGDGIYAYQLAVVVDDLAMAISEVVRGADLLASAPRQVLLAELLGERPPRFAHVPLVVDGEGRRLEKRNPRHTLRGLRALGVGPGVVIAQLARALGLTGAHERAAITVRTLLADAELASLSGRREIRLPD